MNIKPKCHNQEDFELDNVYNDEDRIYNESSNSTIWYNWWDDTMNETNNRVTDITVCGAVVLCEVAEDDVE